MQFENIYNKWNTFNTKDTLFKNSLLKISKQRKFENAFSSSLKIHNSRIVAKMGANTNYLNEFTVIAIAESFANFISQKKNFQNRGIIIGHDNRINSKLYAKTFIHTLNALGIKAYAFFKNKPISHEILPFTIVEKKFEGGILISNSREYKKVNSITFFKEKAFLLSNEDEKIIQKNILKTNYLLLNSFDKKKYQINYLSDEIENVFSNNYLKMYDSNLEKKLDIKITNLHGNSEIFNNIIEKIGFKINTLKSEAYNTRKINPWLLIKKKSYSSSNPKSLRNLILKSTFSKGNFYISINPDGSKFSVAVKHKKRLKYITTSDLAAIYLKYILEDNLKKIKKESLIFKSFGTSSLINKIAKKHNIKVFETFHDLKINEKEQILLAFNEDFGFFDYKRYSNTKSPFIFLITLIEAANFYLVKQNKNLFEVLRLIHNEYQIHRITKKVKITPNDIAKRFINRLYNASKIGRKKIINKYTYDENVSNGKKHVLVLKLIDKSTITIRYNTGDKLLYVFTEVVGKKNEQLMDVVINERQIQNDLEEISEFHKTKKFSLLDFLRYFIFIIFLILIFYFLFQTIYSLNGNPVKIFRDISNLIWTNKANLYIFCSLILFSFFGIVIHSISLKRMLSVLGHNVKLRNLFIGSYLGVAITNITPLPGGGGDVITYWYLRRKGVDRSSLYASILMGSLIYQLVIVLATIIFLPIGIVFYSDVFTNLNTQTITLIIFLSVGTIFDIFGAIMISLISISKKFQESIVKSGIKFLEWIPFIIISDPGKTASRFQYEFNEIRKGIKIIFKKKKYIFEQIFYRFLPWLISATATLGATIFQSAGKIALNTTAETYFNILSGSSLIRAANSISITPGGAGTIDLFTTRIFSNIFVSKNDSAIFSLMDRITTLIIPTFISLLLIFTIYIGERRVDKWNLQNHNNFLLKNKSKARKTRFYKIAIIIWLIFFSVLLITIGFV